MSEKSTKEVNKTIEEKEDLMTIEHIQKKVYMIRGQQVMLDYDLARIYGYDVKRLNEQVKRNINRFPEDFMFQLSKEEIPKDFLKSQIATLNERGNKRGLHFKKMPYAFTEQGVYMLATVLRGDLGSLTPKIAESLIWLIFFNKFKFLVDRTAVLCYNTIIVQKGNVVYEIKN